MVPTQSSPLKQIPILCGPTASGKSALALEYAERHPGTEIINCDSLIVYRHFDIGTAKPSRAELATVPHHLVDIRDPEVRFDAADFVREVARARAEISARGGQPLLVGGTGFYLKALLFGLWDAPETSAAFRASVESIPNGELFSELKKADPASAARIGPNDRYRLIRSLEIFKLSGKTPTELQARTSTAANPDFRLVWIDRADDELFARVTDRTEAMLSAGWIDETRDLRGRFPDAPALRSVGYAQILDYLDGIAPAGRKLAPGIAGLKDEINLATRQLIKSQRTLIRGLAKKLRPESFRSFLLDRDLSAILAELSAASCCRK